MELGHVIAFNIALIAALLSPGPGMLVTIRTTLSNGRRAGIVTGMGLGLIAAGWTGAALLGLETVFILFPWAYLILRICGALYLIYIAISVWRQSAHPAPIAPVSDKRAFLTGAFVNLGNPKSFLFAAAVLLVIFPTGLNFAEMVLIVGNQLVLEWTFYSALAMTLSHNAISKRYLGIKPVLDRIAATLLGAMGLKLLIDR